jgi:GNAT superfamily N-acetyltransferase
MVQSGMDPVPPPKDFLIRTLSEKDYPEISAICAKVYPTERPYTDAELAAHHRLFPEGQFVAIHQPTGAVAGAHFTLMIWLTHFHLDDPWDTLTANGTFLDHDPTGHTLYGADLFVHPAYQHHGLGRTLTWAARNLVSSKNLWRMVGGSRLPGYHKVSTEVSPDEYITKVKSGKMTDPVLTAHLHDGWDAVTAIRGYLPNDDESEGWAAVIQWVNQACPPPPDWAISKVPRKK